MGRRLTFSVLIVAVVFAGAYLWYERHFSAASTRRATASYAEMAPKRPPVSESQQPAAVVVSVEGVVERREGDNGQWIEVRPGEKLGLRDAVRTSGGGRAVLAIGESIKVEVADQSQFAVSEITDTLSNIRLEGGRITARVTGGGANLLKVEVSGSQAVAEANAGEFSVLRAADARVTVAAIKGRVKLSARGKSVEVGSGQQSVVAQDEEPAAPTAIPPSLFLKINTAVPQRLNKTQTDIEGVTVPGAVVTIRGVNVSAGADGVFRAAVPLQEGRNEIVVAVGDALGRKDQQALPEVFVDTKAPKVKSEVTW